MGPLPGGGGSGSLGVGGVLGLLLGIVRTQAGVVPFHAVVAGLLVVTLHLPLAAGVAGGS